MTAPSSFPNGFSHGVEIRGLPILNSYPGKIFYVSSVTGSNGNRGSFERPFASLAYVALAANLKAAASKGDVVVLMPGHTEAVTSAGAITIDIAGLTIVSLGKGDLRPRFTFSGATTASIAVTAANVSFEGAELVCSLEDMANPLDVTGDGCYIDLRGRDASGTAEAARYVLMTGVDRGVVKLKHNGVTGGNGCVNSIRLVGCTDIRIETDFYGKASTGVVEFLTTASTNVNVRGYMYNSGTTDFSKAVVDTVTGSTYSVEYIDGAAGKWVSGGSGAALAGDDISDITDALYGTNGIATWPTAAAYGNGVSIAEALAYVQDGVRRGSGTTMAANKSVADALGTDGTTVTDAAVSVLGAIGADNANNAFASTSVVANKDGSVLERLEDITQELSGTAGIVTFPAALPAANAVSLAEVIRFIQDRSASNALNRNASNYLSVTADFTSATWNTAAAHEIFTVTGAVRMRVLAQVTATPTSAGSAATLILGDETTTNSLITSTDAENLATGEWWFDATDTRTLAIKSIYEKLDFVVQNGKDIGYTIGTEALTGGSIIFHCWWEPISADGAVAAGAGGVL